MYKLQDNGVLRLEDNAVIPADPQNRHWQEYQVWLAEGNTPEPSGTEPTLEDLKQDKLQEINQWADELSNRLTDSYPVSEVSSWYKQELEARAFLEDDEAPTPLLDSMSAARKLEKSILALRIIYKSDLFAVLSGHIIGGRQRLEDLIELATTAAEVNAIKPPTYEESVAFAQGAVSEPEE